MKIKSIQLRNFRSFAEHSPSINLKNINVLIGENNSGKSSILRGLNLIQRDSSVSSKDLRTTEKDAFITITAEEVYYFKPWRNIYPSQGEIATIVINLNKENIKNYTIEVGQRIIHPIQSIDPHHFIIPYYSKRKASTYTEIVNIEASNKITGDISNLAARLSKLTNPSDPRHLLYVNACKDILGFVVSNLPSENGQKPSIYLNAGETISIEQMGEGVPNIVGILAELAISERKLFLIEELENDLHPRALKALLDLIIKSSEVNSNQFVISTHSNIVVKHLGAEPNSCVLKVSAKPDTWPIETMVMAIENTPQARLEVLRELGYSFSDLELWEGWLILEESSAERIIRDYLIPWFAPKLTRIRTLAVGGISQIEPTFEDFNRLVRFTHLEKAYTNAAWVRVDGDDIGKSTITKLQSRYNSWAPQRFSTYSQAQFEQYYPVEFEQRINDALSTTDKQQKRDAKRNLLQEVCKWLDEDLERGKRALLISAQEIIDDLKKIESELQR